MEVHYTEEKPEQKNIIRCLLKADKLHQIVLFFPYFPGNFSYLQNIIIGKFISIE